MEDKQKCLNLSNCFNCKHFIYKRFAVNTKQERKGTEQHRLSLRVIKADSVPFLRRAFPQIKRQM